MSLTLGNKETAHTALILVHGRGGTAENILSLTPSLSLKDVFVVAPQAEGNRWYPERFLVPQTENEPYLSHALTELEVVLSETAMKKEQIVLAGFSQGACLVAEYIKRNPIQYKGVCLWSGGLIGTDEEVRRVIVGDMHHTPLYLGCDAEDFHIPLARVKQTAEYFTQMNATVELDVYNGFGHAIHPRGITALQAILSKEF